MKSVAKRQTKSARPEVCKTISLNLAALLPTIDIKHDYIDVKQVFLDSFAGLVLQKEANDDSVGGG